MQDIENNDIELIKKMEEIYKETLSNSLHIIGCNNPRELTKDDLNVFFQALNKLYELEEEYKKSFDNRDCLGNKISNLASHLMIFANYIQSQVTNDVNRYKTSNELFINDSEKMIYNLFNAQNSSLFALKKVYARGVGSFEVKQGIRETEQIYGTVYIIGDSVALSELEDEKVYLESDIQRFTTKILEKEKSLIVASNYCFENNLLPSTDSSCLEIKGNNSIYCYLKDDVMKEIVNRLLSYAKENGNHINDIPATEILNNISINQKKLKKENNNK